MENSFIIIALFFMVMTNGLEAKSLVKRYDNLEIDWGRMKIRFSGVAKSDDSTSTSYSKLVDQALTNGIVQGKESVIGFHKFSLLAAGIQPDKASLSATEAGELVARSTYAYRTEFFADGSVKVHLENSLVKALSQEDVSFSPSVQIVDENGGRFSGLVLRASSSIEPRARYRVVDETGKLLFQVSDVDRKSYNKNLMGRWLVEPNRSELLAIVGSQPLSVDFWEDRAGQFVVLGQAWSQLAKEGKRLLRGARIAIVVPERN